MGAHYVPSDGAGAEEVGAKARERIRALGNDAYKRGRYDEAFRMYTTALEADDGAPVAERAAPAERATILSNRAAASLGHSDFHAAAEDAAAATLLDPSNAKAWYRLGGALQHTEGAESALRALENAAACAPASLVGDVQVRRDHGSQ